MVKECYILDVNKFKAGINKTDKIDVKKLVKRLAYYIIANGDSNDLPLVYVPPKAVLVAIGGLVGSVAEAALDIIELL